jgi:hypothetical protein
LFGDRLGLAYFDNAPLSVDSVNVYYVGRRIAGAAGFTDIVSAPITGGGLTVVAAGYAPRTVASDGTNVFFNDNLTKTVRFCTRTGTCGTSSRSIADVEADVFAMTLDDTSVIWVRQSGEIGRVAKP